MKKYNTVYQITNILNNYIYIGAHSTNNISDNYMSSSKYVKKDIKQFGKENFIKEILFIFDNREEMLNKEKELVNKTFCYRVDTYNRIIGGSSGSFSFIGMTTVKDKRGITMKVYLDDPRYLSGELVSIHLNKITVKDKDSNTFRINNDDERYLSGELVHNMSGTVNVKDKKGNIFNVNTNNPRYLSGELVHHLKNTITVKDNNGNFLQVPKSDERYLSGELVHNMTDMIVVKDVNDNRMVVHRTDERYVSGELVSIHKGRVGIKSRLGKSVSVEQKQHLSDLAKLRIGNKSSSYGRKSINNGTLHKRVKEEDLNNYLNNGWVLGMLKRK